MTKLKLIMLCVLSLSLLAEEEFYEVVEGVSDTQYEEIGVISEPTILESLNKDNMDVIKFESEIEKEKEAKIVVPVEETEIVKNIEQNVSIKESINPIFVTYDEALKIAKEENKIILLDVVANNCAFCKKMEEEVLSKDNVQEAIKKDFVLAHVNEDREPLPLGLSPQMTPTFVFISKTETVEDMRFGFIDEEKFLILLEKQNEDISNR
jgi:thioredoxin-related protein